MYILLCLECIRFQKSVFTFDKKSTKKKKRKLDSKPKRQKVVVNKEK